MPLTPRFALGQRGQEKHTERTNCLGFCGHHGSMYDGKASEIGENKGEYP